MTVLDQFGFSAMDYETVAIQLNAANGTSLQGSDVSAMVAAAAPAITTQSLNVLTALVAIIKMHAG